MSHSKKQQKKPEQLALLYETLHKHYGEQHCFLNHDTPFQLLVAVILSAQCTDKTVNAHTPQLFAEYPNAPRLANAPLEKVEHLIRAIGLYKAKAKYIVGTAQMLCEKFGGEVPQTMEELTQLPGVGRKTANVMLSDAFHGEGFAVDTHVKRITQRIGIVRTDDPERIELKIKKYFPNPERLGQFSLLLITHGRSVCLARNPRCTQCPIQKLCAQN